jgi:hypothetical protein
MSELGFLFIHLIEREKWGRGSTKQSIHERNDTEIFDWECGGGVGAGGDSE